MLSALASAASKAGAHAGGAAQQASGGLPQLNVSDYAPQLIWLAGIFVTLYLVMSKWIIPNVGSVLQERADRIGKDLGEAQRLKAETAKALANYEQALSEAKAGAQKIVDENRAVLNAEINKERALVEARIATQTAEADKRIAAAKTQAMGSVDEIAGDTARAIVGQLIGLDVGAAEASQAVLAGRRG